MVKIKNAERVIVRENEVVFLKDGKEYSKNLSNPIIRGEKLSVENLKCNGNGFIRGTIEKLCSHNKIYICGSLKLAKGVVENNQYIVDKRISSYLQSINLSERPGLLLQGNIGSLLIYDVFSDLQGKFEECEYLGNCYVIGTCLRAIAYNSVYN